VISGIRWDPFFHDVLTLADVSPGQVDEAIDLYNSGWSLARVGEHLAVDPTTVLNRLRERGVRTRDTHGRVGLDVLAAPRWITSSVRADTQP